MSSPNPSPGPVATYNPQVVAQGLARLTSAFVTQPNARAMLAVYLQPWQDLEDAAWAAFTSRLLRTATVYTLPQTNNVFDVIGQLVGLPARGSLSDLAMKALILLRVAVNRSTGRVTDWSSFANILTPYCDRVPVYYDDQAGIYFGCWNLQFPPLTVAQALSRAPPNGVAAELAYSTWADGNDFMWAHRGFPDFGLFTGLMQPTQWFDYTESAAAWFDPDLVLGSAPTVTGGQGTWSSRYNTSVGGYWVANATLQ